MLTSVQNSGEVKCRPQIKLLEFDERFAVFKEFVRYDFEKAIQLPAEMKASFDSSKAEPSRQKATPHVLGQPHLARNKLPASSSLLSPIHTRTNQPTLPIRESSRVLSASLDPCLIQQWLTEWLGEIPSMKIFESEKTLAFLDIGPLSKGHSLIIPKHHGAKLHDIPDDQLAEVLSVTKRIAIAQNIQDYNILQNNGRIAHQVVDHVHFHLIPKPNEQEGLGIGWPTKEADKGELSKLLEEIKSKM
ncbi:N-6 adenine-specific DNA methyltransferase 2 [Alternaria alternata]|nr:N-6 adenine-specific DNA methyltransferase 2 [Alternaria alternata]